MAKHSIEGDIVQDSKYGKIIARQGERLVFLENKVKELESQLVQERANRIEDLQTIKYMAASNIYNNKEIAEAISDTLEQITNGIIKKEKELSLNTDQSIKN